MSHADNITNCWLSVVKYAKIIPKGFLMHFFTDKLALNTLAKTMNHTFVRINHFMLFLTTYKVRDR